MIKFITMIILAILSLTSEGLAQWQVHKAVCADRFRSAYFISADTGFVAGNRCIVRTTNGGQKWLFHGVDGEHSTIFFPSSGFGLAAGAGIASQGRRTISITRTNDGGRTWQNVFDSAVTDESSFSALYFTSESDGFAVTRAGSYNDCILMLTHDAGRTWNRNTTDQIGLVGSIETMTFTTDLTGYAGGSSETSAGTFSALFQTVDGGKTWNWFPSWTFHPHTGFVLIRTVHFTSKMTGWVGGGRFRRHPNRETNSRVFFTTDAGETWDTTKFVFPYTVNTIVFANDRVGFIGDTAGNIYSTIDGGTTWKNDNAPSNGRSINSIAIAGGTAVYAVGDGGLILKRDIPTSVNEEHLAIGVNIFPNPSSGRVRIRINNYLGEAVVTINDVLGREVYAATLQQNDADVDLGSLPRGMYTVQVRIGGNVKSNLLVLGRE